MEKSMNKDGANRRIDEFIYQYTQACFGDNAKKIIHEIESGRFPDDDLEYPIEMALNAKKDVSDDPIRNFYIVNYIECMLAFSRYEPILIEEGYLR